jgi:hypothetical protein
VTVDYRLPFVAQKETPGKAEGSWSKLGAIVRASSLLHLIIRWLGQLAIIGQDAVEQPLQVRLLGT